MDKIDREKIMLREYIKNNFLKTFVSNMQIIFFLQFSTQALLFYHIYVLYDYLILDVLIIVLLQKL